MQGPGSSEKLLFETYTTFPSPLSLQDEPFCNDSASSPSPDIRTQPRACGRCSRRRIRCCRRLPCNNCLYAGRESECAAGRERRFINKSPSSFDSSAKKKCSKKPRRSAPPKPVHPATGRPNDKDEALDLPAETNDSAPKDLDSLPSEFPVTIGAASDVAFATWFREVVSEHRQETLSDVPSVAIYEITPPVSATESPFPNPVLARLLVDIAVKRVCQDYCIVQEKDILQGLEEEIVHPHSTNAFVESKLWALLAIGETQMSLPTDGGAIPGHGYFSKAVGMLSTITSMDQPSKTETITHTIELLLLLAYYNLSLDRVRSAWHFVGSAVRHANAIGMHLKTKGPKAADPHKNGLWWTAFLLDRLISTQVGCPVAVPESIVTAKLLKGQSFRDPPYLAARVELARLQDRIRESIYGLHQEQSLQERVEEALADLQGWAKRLPENLLMDRPGAANLFLRLSLNQSVIMASRPTLIDALRMHQKAEADYLVSCSVPRLANICIQGARQSFELLVQHWICNTFAISSHPYTSYMFSAATVLAISSMLNTSQSQSDRRRFDMAHEVLLQLKENGSHIAIEYCQHLEAIKKLFGLPMDYSALSNVFRYMRDLQNQNEGSIPEGLSADASLLELPDSFSEEQLLQL